MPPVEQMKTSLNGLDKSPAIKALALAGDTQTPGDRSLKLNAQEVIKLFKNHMPDSTDLEILRVARKCLYEMTENVRGFAMPSDREWGATFGCLALYRSQKLEADETEDDRLNRFGHVMDALITKHLAASPPRSQQQQVISPATTAPISLFPPGKESVANEYLLTSMQQEFAALRNKEMARLRAELDQYQAQRMQEIRAVSQTAPPQVQQDPTQALVVQMMGMFQDISRFENIKY